MCITIDIRMNGRMVLAQYTITRITNTDNAKPVGTVNKYVVKKIYPEVYPEETITYEPIEHAYDEPVEMLVKTAMQEICSWKGDC